MRSNNNHIQAIFPTTFLRRYYLRPDSHLFLSWKTWISTVSCLICNTGNIRGTWRENIYQKLDLFSFVVGIRNHVASKQYSRMNNLPTLLIEFPTRIPSYCYPKQESDSIIHGSTNSLLKLFPYHLKLLYGIAWTILLQMLKVTLFLQTLFSRFQDHIETVFVSAAILKVFNLSVGWARVSVTYNNINSNTAFIFLNCKCRHDVRSTVVATRGVLWKKSVLRNFAKFTGKHLFYRTTGRLLLKPTSHFLLCCNMFTAQ